VARLRDDGNGKKAALGGAAALGVL